jgi:hypothetical protein
MSTTAPGRACPEAGAVASPVQRHPGLALAAVTTAGRDLLDKATAVLAAIAHEHIASRLPDADPANSPRRCASPARVHPRPASAEERQQLRRDNMSQPARPDPARTLRARNWPAPAPPAHPQHRSPAQRGTIAGLAPVQPMTPASPAAAIGPMTTGSAATATGPQISARLPVSDWQIRWRLQPDGRTVLEVTDQAGNLTGLAASTRLPIVSVDGAWRGTRRSADGSRQRWALAIGHADTTDGPLTVTFTSRARRTTIHPATVDGLWVAAITGHYTAASCHTPAAHRHFS